jgi:hypothetical protein
MKPHLFEVSVEIRSDWEKPLFTGKLVKSILIESEPSLKRFFEKKNGEAPKLLHITPLYQINGEKIECIYSRVVSNKNDVPIVNPVKINGLYRFYIGFLDGGLEGSLSYDLTFKTLTNISGKIFFKKHLFNIELISVREIDVEKISREVVRNLLKNEIMKIIFSSPTLLKDPFREGKHKSLIPTPMNIFSVPASIYLYVYGRYSKKNLLQILKIFHRVINETHSLMRSEIDKGTIKKVFVQYEEKKNPIPSIIGYANYRLNRKYLEHYQKKIEIEKLLEDTMTIMLTLGTGTSRATGFGHITTK